LAPAISPTNILLIHSIMSWYVHMMIIDGSVDYIVLFDTRQRSVGVHCGWIRTQQDQILCINRRE
jgi:hypothetical protein